jgi:large subunit ribosomal protein L24
VVINLKRATFSSKPGRTRKNLSLGKQFEKSSSNLRAALAADLKSKYSRNTIRVRPGDSVKLFRGEYSGVEGKIQKVFPGEGRITIEGVTREKIAGGTTPIRIHASNVVVTNLNLDDKLRRTKLEGSR